MGKLAKPEFHTPVAIQRIYQEEWAKLEAAPFPDKDLTELKEMTHFNNPATYKHMPEYDHFFAYTKTFPLYDQRKRRDNRAYCPDIRDRIHQQEERKPVPVLTSLTYGRPCRVQYDFPARQYNRQAEIASLYRRQGVMPPIERELQ